MFSSEQIYLRTSIMYFKCQSLKIAILIVYISYRLQIFAGGKYWNAFYCFKMEVEVSWYANGWS